MNIQNARLLLVDDDPSAIQIMGRMLAQYPDQRFATSGADALRLARERVPDLILLDYEMPGMTGFDVCEALKADPLLANVPVIFATIHDAATLLKFASPQKGVAVFVNKPLNAAQLTAGVRRVLRSKEHVREVKPEPVSSPT
jgi:two-component system, cell cycle response regulator